MRKFVISNDHDLMETIGNCVLCLADAGRYAQALPLARERCAWDQREYGKLSPKLEPMLELLNECHRGIEMHAGAQSAQSQMEQAVGEFNTLDSLQRGSQAAALLLQAGKGEEAVDMF